MIEPKLWMRYRVQLRDGAIVVGKVTDIAKTPGGVHIRVVHGDLISTVAPIQLLQIIDEKETADA